MCGAVSAGSLLLVFRVTREVDNLSIYAYFRSFSPSRMRKPGKIILYGEFLPSSILGGKETIKRKVNKSVNWCLGGPGAPLSVFAHLDW